MFKGIKAVFLFVDNPIESAKWHSQLLSLPIEIEQENFCLINNNGTELCFHLTDQKSPLSTGGSVSYWNIENFDAVLNKAKDLDGVVYRGPLKIEEEENRWIAQIKDPYGNIIGIDGPKI